MYLVHFGNAHHELLERFWCHVRLKGLHNAYSSRLRYLKSQHRFPYGDMITYLEIAGKADIVYMSTRRGLSFSFITQGDARYSPELVLFTP